MTIIIHSAYCIILSDTHNTIVHCVSAVCDVYKRELLSVVFVCGHTHVNVFVPVSLTKIKRVLVESVQRRVTTPEYSMLQAIFFLAFFCNETSE